ncbi:cyclin-J-like [Gigantopelta aegis]|uniref:cyclin-J-like n=1 Tax=Gigantopelta aegis TaxID=1735272 RepID=UPI001B88CF82|nr:cyclin-J-like [Gigantopelta aegis]XP_041370741.1 cyclin-J-like [Gigantopelta aegis]XP_041370742.1 cyclin-J-like [Gigantopelta aegis]
MMEIEWWKNLIGADIYATLKQMEQEIQPFRCQCSKLWTRRHLVDWMSLIVEQLSLSTVTQHLAVYLLDYFMDCMEVEHHHLYLLAMTCLRVAAKFEEHTDKVPRPSTLNALLPKSFSSALQGYTLQQFLAMELTLLKHHNWHLAVPTSANFLPYFLTIAADDGDLHNGVPITSKSLVTSYIEKHSHYFLEISLQDHTFRGYHPSLISAASVAASRICLNLTPTWPKHMMLLTDYYLEELIPCLQMMLRARQRDDINQNTPQTVVSLPTSMPQAAPLPSVPYGVAPIPSVPYGAASTQYLDYSPDTQVHHSVFSLVGTTPILSMGRFSIIQ